MPKPCEKVARKNSSPAVVGNGTSIPMRKIHWGVLGTARIGVNKVIPALQKSSHGTVAALASRDLAQAQSVAQRLGIPHAHGSYEALLADPMIDAVYIP